IVFLAYIHGAKVHVFRLRHPNHPIILRNSLIIIVRYMMAQKSDEVRTVPFLTHYQLVCTNFDFSSFSLISYTAIWHILPGK
ncbi:MAG: hypothetical protein SPI18_00400, partial [Prevotella sp.]|nr:hypothetical protein [Prevotella sp.]